MCQTGKSSARNPARHRRHDGLRRRYSHNRGIPINDSRVAPSALLKIASTKSTGIPALSANLYANRRPNCTLAASTTVILSDVIKSVRGVTSSPVLADGASCGEDPLLQPYSSQVVGALPDAYDYFPAK